MTPNPRFKVTPIFDAEYVISGTRQTYFGLVRSFTRHIHWCNFD